LGYGAFLINGGIYLKEESKSRITKIIWLLCGLIILGTFGIPRLYKNYHSAPYYKVTGQTIIIENKKSKVHKLNEYQKNQFLKIAKKTIDTKDGPFNWKNYTIESIDIYKTEKRFQYGLILKIKPNLNVKQSSISCSMIVKLDDQNLMNYYNFFIKSYSSNFFNGDK